MGTGLPWSSTRARSINLLGTHAHHLPKLAFIAKNSDHFSIIPPDNAFCLFLFVQDENGRQVTYNELLKYSKD